MQFAPIVLLGVMAVSSAVGIPAQKTPDFSGHWVIDPASAPSADSPRSNFCLRGCEIVQDSKTVTVTLPGRKVVYRVDGTPDKTTITNGRYSTVMTVTAKWKGETLVITRQTGDLDPVTMEITEEKGRMAVQTGGTLLASAAKVFYLRKPAVPKGK